MKGWCNMNYFEVLYADCFGDKKRALIATSHATPETPTADFNFNWNGNRLIDYHKTDRDSYSRNIYRFY
jgi:hypothetical protein